MEVHEESFCDHGEPDEDGFHSYRYEGTVWIFDFGEGRTVHGRRYSHTPTRASLYSNPEGPAEGDAELDDVVDWLHSAGVSEVEVLGGCTGTYRPLRQLG